MTLGPQPPNPLSPVPRGLSGESPTPIGETRQLVDILRRKGLEHAQVEADRAAELRDLEASLDHDQRRVAVEAQRYELRAMQQRVVDAAARARQERQAEQYDTRATRMRTERLRQQRTTGLIVIGGCGLLGVALGYALTGERS